MRAVEVLNFGSLNIDHVYGVARFATAGETLPTTSYRVFSGGKGFNQSIALARAGARVAHAGRIGSDGQWLLALLEREGVRTGAVARAECASGHAVIQVRNDGENAILVHGGANREIDAAQVDAVLDGLPDGGTLLLQNEISELPRILEAAAGRGAHVVLNPSPLDDAILDTALDAVGTLILNETEGRALGGVGGDGDDAAVLAALTTRFPRAEVVLTLGARGACYARGSDRARCRAPAVDAVDTTGAGDTFTGFYLAAWLRGDPVPVRLAEACRAAALAVTRPGAADAIPRRDEL